MIALDHHEIGAYHVDQLRMQARQAADARLVARHRTSVRDRVRRALHSK